MIVQGSNSPLILDFGTEVDATDIHITIYHGSTQLKRWTKDDVTVDGTTVTCPLTQAETLAFPACTVQVEAKWLDSAGNVVFAETITTTIKKRQDGDTLGSDS